MPPSVSITAKSCSDAFAQLTAVIINITADSNKQLLLAGSNSGLMAPIIDKIPKEVKTFDVKT